MSSMNKLKIWVKDGDGLMAGLLRKAFYSWRYFTVPVIPGLHSFLYRLHMSIRRIWLWTVQSFYFSPVFRSRCESCGSQLYLYTGMPYIAGPLRIRIGNNCRVSGLSTFNGRSASKETPLLEIGDNCDIGWQNMLSVGTRIRIGNNVRLAGKVLLSGYSGHPVDAEDRAAGLPDTDDQARDIVLEDDVWVGTGAMINAGVTVGRGSIIASGAVVTKDVPPFHLAGGNPAKLIKELPQ